MDEKIKPKIVKTYAEDMAKVIEDGAGGMIKKIIQEEKENEVERQNLSPQSIKNRLFLLIGIVFLLSALALLFYFVFTKDISTVEVEQPFIHLIFNDESDFIEVAGLKKDGIIQNIRDEIKISKIKTGGVEGIYLAENKKVIGLRRFVELIKGNLALADLDLVKDYFLMGFVNNESQPASSSGRDFFILLKVRSVADIFNDMRLWEGKMFFDLHGFFEIDITPDTKDFLTKNFEDGIVQNKNARILYKKNGQQDGEIVLMYVFADDTSVIITNTKNAVHEIMLRLASSKVEK